MFEKPGILTPSVHNSVLRNVLNDRMNDLQYLEQAPTIVSELHSQCLNLDNSLVGLNSSLESSLLGYTSFSDRVHVLITDTAAELTALDSSTAVSFVGGRAKEQALAEELPALAKEVARVKIVRDYAGFETERVWCFCLYKPEFNFALVYKITRDYVDTMDELLQPLVDKARLVAGEDRNLEKFSSLYVFCDRPDWLDLWAEIEFSDTLENVKFYDSGVESLSNDLEVLFGAFRAWCLRTQGFSPKSSEGLKLLKMRRKQHNLGLTGDDNWMKENGVRHMTVSEAKKMLKSRMFGSLANSELYTSKTP
ncbi:unnamed protein product [Linum tenue]|uniref:Uncharacterized protein n=1 Tax=Linum tenue TaxID=586396 RepID=A0AAV0QW88_9ROSI|nr:unnamed protein product [Linum tenue]